MSRRVHCAERVLAGVLGTIIWFHLIASLAPPTYADVLNAYLALPKLFVRAHGFYFSHNLFAGLPGGFESLVTAGLLLRNGVVGTISSFALGVGAMAGLYIVMRKHLRMPRVYALAGVVLFACLPPVVIYLPTAKPDLALASYSVLAIYSFLNWVDTRSSRWVALAGIFVGFAIGAKTHGLFVLAGIGSCFLCDLVKDGRSAPRRRFLSFLCFALIAVAVGSPSYMRNYAWTGNPFWPMMNEIFNGCCLSSADSTMLEALRAPSEGSSVFDFVMGPWWLMADATHFKNRNHFAVPALIALLPGILLVPFSCVPGGRKCRAAFLFIAVFAAVYYGLWYLNRPRGHYLLPLWPALTLMAAFVMYGLSRRSRLTAWAGMVVMGFSILVGIGTMGLVDAQFIPVVFGAENTDDFLRRNTWYYDDIKHINEHLPPDAVLICFPMATYYLDVDYIPIGVQHFGGVIDYSEIDTTEELLSEWRNARVTHVFWDQIWFDGSIEGAGKRYTSWDFPRLFDELEADGRLVPVYSNDTSVPTSRSLGFRRSSRVVVFEVHY